MTITRVASRKNLGNDSRFDRITDVRRDPMALRRGQMAVCFRGIGKQIMSDERRTRIYRTFIITTCGGNFQDFMNTTFDRHASQIRFHFGRYFTIEPEILRNHGTEVALHNVLVVC